jgi:hypothetical protein
MRLTASPAKLVGIVRATDETAALAQAIALPHSAARPKAAYRRACRVVTLTPAQFAKVGEALYGPSWRAALAQALEVSECNYITEFPRPIVAQPQRPMD